MWRHACLVFFIGVFLRCGVCQPAWAADRALLIGIDAYGGAGVPALVGSVNDVRNMQRFVHDKWRYQPDQVKLLLNAQATREGILTAMRTWLVQGSRAGDRVLFYYSGHGSQMPDQGDDEEDRLDETLVSVDTYMDQQGVFQNMVSDDEIQAVFDQLRDRQVTVIIDSCHSGTATRALTPVACENVKYHKHPVLGCGSRGRPANAKTLQARRREVSFLPEESNRVVWSAVSAAQVAFVHQEIQPPRGVFTHHFLEGAEGRADRNGNGRVSHAELLAYLREQSTAYCERRRGDCPLGLTPTLEASRAVLKQAVIGPQAAPSPPVAPPPVPLQEVATEVLAPDNIGDVHLTIEPGSPVRLGTAVRFRVRSAQDGYVVVLDINPNGQLVQLFPNRYSEQAGVGNRLSAQRPLTIPDTYYGFDFRAAEPVGQGTLLAVVTTDPVDLGAMLSVHRDLEVIPNAADYLTRLSDYLHEVWREDTVNRPVQWSLGTLAYEITR